MKLHTYIALTLITISNLTSALSVTKWPTFANLKEPPIFGLLPIKCLPFVDSRAKFCTCVNEKNVKPLPLKKMIVDSKMERNLVQSTVELQYVNTQDKPIQAVFTFPVSKTTAVYSLVSTINGETITAEIKSKENAKKAYDLAVKSGNIATLLEEEKETSDILKLYVGNIDANATAKIVIKLIDDLPYTKTTKGFVFNYLFPTSLFPRFTPKNLTDPIPILLPEPIRPFGPIRKAKSGIIPMLPKPKKCIIISHDIDYSMDFKLHVHEASSFRVPDMQTDIFMPCQNLITSLTQEKTGISRDIDNDKDIATFSFKKSKNVFHKDADISINFIQDNKNKDFLNTEKYDISMDTKYEKNTYNDKNYDSYLARSAVTVNPGALKTTTFDKNEYIFIVDCSGSMGGSRIEDSKSMLKLLISSLPADSYFNIIKFGSRYEVLFKETEKYSDSTKGKAEQLIDQLSANCGGTNLVPALQYAFQSKIVLKTQKRNVFVLTDGAISNTYDAIRMVKQNSDKNKVFTFGLGAGSSTYLVDGLASAGNGYASYVNEYRDKALEKYFTKKSLSSIVVESVMAASQSNIVSNLQLCVSEFGKLFTKPKVTCHEPKTSDVNLPNVLVEGSIFNIYYDIDVSALKTQDLNVMIELKSNSKTIASSSLVLKMVKNQKSNKSLVPTNLEISNFNYGTITKMSPKILNENENLTKDEETSRDKPKLIGILYAKRTMMKIAKDLAQSSKYSQDNSKKTQIIELSKKSNVLSPFTSLVAVSENGKKVVGGGAITKVVKIDRPMYEIASFGGSSSAWSSHPRPSYYNSRSRMRNFGGSHSYRSRPPPRRYGSPGRTGSAGRSGRRGSRYNIAPRVFKNFASIAAPRISLSYSRSPPKSHIKLMSYGLSNSIPRSHNRLASSWAAPTMSPITRIPLAPRTTTIPTKQNPSDYKPIMSLQKASGGFHQNIYKLLPNSLLLQNSTQKIKADKAWIQTVVAITELLSDKFGSKRTEIQMLLSKAFKFVRSATNCKCTDSNGKSVQGSSETDAFVKSSIKEVAVMMGYSGRELRNILALMGNFI